MIFVEHCFECRYLLPQSLDGTNEAAPYTHTVDSDGRIDKAVGYGRVPQCTVHPRTRPGAYCYVCCFCVCLCVCVSVYLCVPVAASLT